MTKKKERLIPRPSTKNVLDAQKSWEKLDGQKYKIQEDALNELFGKHPNNDRLEDILLKAATLNDFYNTNVLSIFGVAKHILTITNIDERLAKADESLIKDLMKNSFIDKIGETKEINFYSFATKYCSHHNPDNYPIYDGYVDKVLRYFRTHENFSSFRNNELKDYKKFKSIIIQFRNYYDLKDFSFKEIDRYLWQTGKKFFQKKTTRSKKNEKYK